MASATRRRAAGHVRRFCRPCAGCPIAVLSSSQTAASQRWICSLRSAAMSAGSPLRLDASLFRPPPKRRKGQRGRPLPKGRALPKLSAMLTSKRTAWTSVVVSQWYNAQQRQLLVATGTALWYHAGIPPVPIRWVLVRDPAGEHEPPAFLGTDLDAQPAMILDWFVSRWRVQTNFQEVRAHLGVETPASVVRSGDPAHHAGLAGVILADHRAGRSWAGRHGLHHRSR